jgi:hypothetical protein
MAPVISGPSVVIQISGATQEGCIGPEMIGSFGQDGLYLLSGQYIHDPGGLFVSLIIPKIKSTVRKDGIRVTGGGIPHLKAVPFQKYR